MTAAIFSLNRTAHTVHWHFVTMSVSNVVVIVLMLLCSRSRSSFRSRGLAGRDARDERSGPAILDGSA
jgi:hypothetical protein